MTEMAIRLDTVDKVKNFVNTTNKFECDLDIISSSKRYVIDAKSIMGIFSLDLSKNLTLVIHSKDTKETEAVKTALKDFAA